MNTEACALATELLDACTSSPPTSKWTFSACAPRPPPFWFTQNMCIIVLHCYFNICMVIRLGMHTQRWDLFPYRWSSPNLGFQYPIHRGFFLGGGGEGRMGGRYLTTVLWSTAGLISKKQNKTKFHKERKLRKNTREAESLVPSEGTSAQQLYHRLAVAAQCGNQAELLQCSSSKKWEGNRNSAPFQCSAPWWPKSPVLVGGSSHAAGLGLFLPTIWKGCELSAEATLSLCWGTACGWGEEGPVLFRPTALSIRLPSTGHSYTALCQEISEQNRLDTQDTEDGENMGTGW